MQTHTSPSSVNLTTLVIRLIRTRRKLRPKHLPICGTAEPKEVSKKRMNDVLQPRLLPFATLPSGQGTFRMAGASPAYWSFFN
jgi:hypothetical protein